MSEHNTDLCFVIRNEQVSEQFAGLLLHIHILAIQIFKNTDKVQS